MGHPPLLAAKHSAAIPAPLLLSLLPLPLPPLLPLTLPCCPPSLRRSPRGCSPQLSREYVVRFSSDSAALL